MLSRKTIVTLILLALTLAVTACGPGAMRRPAPGPGPVPAPGSARRALPGPPPAGAVTPPGAGGTAAGSTTTGGALGEEGLLSYPSPRAGSSYDDASTGVSTVASAVPGAGRVAAVVLGNVALLGMNSQDPAVHRKVAEQLHSSFPHIADVRVSTDPAVVARLNEVAGRIRIQQTVLPYLPELANLAAGMPSAR